MKSFDVAIVGGGHNGLACAILLARSGRKVLVCEAGAAPGGAARMEEFAPGFRTSLAPLLSRLHKETIDALGLSSHRLDLSGCAIDTLVVSPGAEPLRLRGDYGEDIDGLDAPERDAWRGLRAKLFRFAGMLRPFLFRPPPDMAGGTLREKLTLGSAAIGLRRLGREDMREFLRLILTNVADLAEDELADDRLRGLLSFDAVMGSHLGPRSPTSLLGLYYRLAGDVGGHAGRLVMPKGGSGAVVEAMLGAATAAGVTVRTGAAVARIRVAAGRVAGVALAGGEEIDAPIVVSAANPCTTFLDLVGPRHVDAGFAARLRHVRMKGNVARLDLALDRPAVFPGESGSGRNARIVVAPSVDHVERAFNAVKYGEVAADPVLEIVQPSTTDPSLAPAGAAVISVAVPFVPYGFGESSDGAREGLIETLVSKLDALSPGLRRTVRHARLRTPADIERDYLIPGGHWHHGELQVDQMLVNRPVHGADRYATPIDGLYLAGAGSHPGGGISGVPGMNAARRILELEKP